MIIKIGQIKFCGGLSILSGGGIVHQWVTYLHCSLSILKGGDKALSLPIRQYPYFTKKRGALILDGKFLNKAVSLFY